MSRSNPLEQELAQIMDRTLTFQRFFGHINLMKQKSAEAEKHLHQLMKRFEKAKINKRLEKEADLIVDIMRTHRKIYAYGKQKIAVCQQFQDALAKTKIDLDQLKKVQRRSASKRNPRYNSYYTYGHSQSAQKTKDQGKMLKSRIKRIKGQKHGVQSQNSFINNHSISTTLQEDLPQPEPMDIEAPVF